MKKTENILIYQDSTETIRQMPQNYCIAINKNGKWRLDPDIASDENLVSRVAKKLLNYQIAYGTGLELLAAVTPNSEFEKEEIIVEKKDIAVIDQSTNSLFLYNVPKDYDNEEIEGYINSQGHRLSNTSWGEFDGIIEDQREVV